MAITRVKTWSAGEVLTANDLNNEFNNLANTALTEPFVATQQVDLNGQLLILDADADTLLDASTDDVVDVTIAGADDFRFAANVFTALSGSSITLAAGNVNMTSGDVAFTAGRVLWAKGANVASATTLTAPTDGNVFDLTGTTPIEGMSTTQAGTTYRIRYTGAGLTLVYNGTSFILPFATDYRLVTNEVFELVSLGSGNYYMVPLSGAPQAEPGTLFPWWGSSAPTGGLLMDASAVNCTTYMALAKKLVPNASTLGNVSTSVAVCTADAGTDVITCTSHGLSVNDLIHFTNSGGALPTGISANTVYYVKTVPGASTLTISATRGGATLDITGAGSGTHTLHNKVNVPDLRGRVWVGLDNLGGSAASRITSSSTNGGNSTTLGGAGGAQTHTLVVSETPAHTHDTNIGAYGAPWTPLGQLYPTLDGTTGQITTSSTGGNGAHSNTQPWLAGGYAIRF